MSSSSTPQPIPYGSPITLALAKQVCGRRREGSSGQQLADGYRGRGQQRPPRDPAQTRSRAVGKHSNCPAQGGNGSQFQTSHQGLRSDARGGWSRPSLARCRQCLSAGRWVAVVEERGSDWWYRRLGHAVDARCAGSRGRCERGQLQRAIAQICASSHGLTCERIESTCPSGSLKKAIHSSVPSWCR